MEGSILVAVVSILRCLFTSILLSCALTSYIIVFANRTDYSAIARSAESQTHAHIVFIYSKRENEFTVEMGTLISESFGLSTATATYNLIVIRSYVKFYNGDEYNVVEKYIHPLFNTTYYSNNNLGLLRMESETILDSSHRPACLWTKNYFESAYVELYKINGGTSDNKFYCMLLIELIAQYS